MAEDRVKIAAGELVCVEDEFLGVMRAREPLHVVFDKQLNDFAAELNAALESFVRAAGGGHVGSEFHVGER